MNGRLKNWLKGEAPYVLLDLSLIAVLAVILAHWTWVFVAPDAVGASANAASGRGSAADAPVKRQLFGTPRDTVAAHDAASSSRFRLVGTASPAAPEGGRAVFVLHDGKSRTLRAGESVAPGAVLREVHPDHVLVERNGAVERFSLERRTAGLGSPAGAGRNGGR